MAENMFRLILHLYLFRFIHCVSQENQFDCFDQQRRISAASALIGRTLISNNNNINTSYAAH